MISYQDEQYIDVEKIDDPVLLPLLRITFFQLMFTVMSSSLLARISKPLSIIILIALPIICAQWNRQIIKGRPLVLRRWLVPVAELAPITRTLIIGLDEIEVDEKVYYES